MRRDPHQSIAKKVRLQQPRAPTNKQAAPPNNQPASPWKLPSTTAPKKIPGCCCCEEPWQTAVCMQPQHERAAMPAECCWAGWRQGRVATQPPSQPLGAKATEVPQSCACGGLWTGAAGETPHLLHALAVLSTPPASEERAACVTRVPQKGLTSPAQPRSQHTAQIASTSILACPVCLRAHHARPRSQVLTTPPTTPRPAPPLRPTPPCHPTHPPSSQPAPQHMILLNQSMEQHAGAYTCHLTQCQVLREAPWELCTPLSSHTLLPFLSAATSSKPPA